MALKEAIAINHDGKLAGRDVVLQHSGLAFLIRNNSKALLTSDNSSERYTRIFLAFRTRVDDALAVH
jgi:hypothetical protein